jgi:predicted permease
MRWLYKLPLRLRSLFRRGRVEKDLSDELRLHLDQLIEENIAQGMTSQEARYAALCELGGVEQIKEECRDMRRVNLIERTIKDLRFAVRQLRHNPGFTAVAVITLALGIGANTAIFSMVDGILLRSLPYQEPGGLYVVREDLQMGAQLFPGNVDNGGNFLAWQRNCHSFAGLAALQPSSDNLDLGDGAVQVHGTRASATLFSMLGVQPSLGRGFLPEEDVPGRSQEVILTDPLWRAKFDSDPHIVGKVIRLNGYDFTVVGVLPSGFYFPKVSQLDATPIAGWTSEIEYFLPLALQPWESKPSAGNNMNFTVIARVKAGVPAQQALADLDAVEADISRHDPQNADGAVLRGSLLPLKAVVVGDTSKTLWMLMAGSGVMLLIVCVNLASLVLAHSMSRAHELAVRAALGATRWDLLRQGLTEGALLVIAGGALGLLLAVDGLREIIHLAPVSIPRLDSIHLDSRVLLFSIAVSLVSGLLFSILPSLRLSRAQPADALKSTASTTTGARATARLRDVLAGAEVALCTILLAAALLLAGSLARVLKENNWLEVQHVLAIDLIAPPHEYGTQAERQLLYDRLLREIAALPGVRTVGFSNALPLRGEIWTDSFNFQETPQGEQNQTNANVRFASPDYFAALGLPLVRGRFFAAGDEGQDEVIVSEGFATAASPGRDPIGMHIPWHSPSGKVLLCTVTGIVADARAEADQSAPRIVYFPYWEWNPVEISLVVRSAGDPRIAAADVHSAVRRLDSRIAIPSEETLQEVVNEAVAPRRFVATLGLSFAFFATFLAALGLYGVISLSVAQRTPEIGIRMALGARQADVLRMVIAKGLRVSLAGLAVGLAAAFPLTSLITSLLYGVKPTNPLLLAVVVLILGGVAGLASLIPGRRATRVDPIVALRHE